MTGTLQTAMERQGLSVSVTGITAQVMTPTGSTIIMANSGDSSTSSSSVSLPIIGAAVGGVVGIALAGVAFFMYRRHKVRTNVQCWPFGFLTCLVDVKSFKVQV